MKTKKGSFDLERDFKNIVEDVACYKIKGMAVDSINLVYIVYFENYKYIKIYMLDFEKMKHLNLREQLEMVVREELKGW